MYELFKHLPRDAVHLILSYNGTIKFRRGEYVNQLSPWDSRRIMLRKFFVPYRLPFTTQYVDRVRTEVDFHLTYYSLFCEERGGTNYVRYYFRTIKQKENGIYDIRRDEYKRY